MRKYLTALSVFTILFTTSLTAASNTYLDYQNYNHGYCADCNCAPCSCAQPAAPCNQPAPEPCGPCDPCAPVCGSECGISLCAIGVGLAAAAAAAVIIVTSGNGSAHAH